MTTNIPRGECSVLEQTHSIHGDQIRLESDQVALQLNQLHLILNQTHALLVRLDDVTHALQREADISCVRVVVSVMYKKA